MVLSPARRSGLASMTVVAALLVAGCGSSGTASSSHTLQVVAGQNFWGSIAAQLGGTHVSVTRIVPNPNADPHTYASSTQDARAFATVDYVNPHGPSFNHWSSQRLS